MQIDTSKKIREVAGEHIVIKQADGVADMTQVIGLNETALLLYNELKGSDFQIDDAVRVLTEHYDVDEATARHDVEQWAAEMKQQGLLKD